MQDEFFPLLRTLPAQHSRRRHHTNIETVKVVEIKSDGILHKVTYHILYSLRAQVAKFAVDLYLVLVDSCSIFIDVFINLTGRFQ